MNVHKFKEKLFTDCQNWCPLNHKISEATERLKKSALFLCWLRMLLDKVLCAAELPWSTLSRRKDNIAHFVDK